MARVYTVAFLLFALSYTSIAVPPAIEASQLQKGYYIVVAAYLSNQEGFASRYALELNKAGKHAKFGRDGQRKMIYVYLDYYTDFSESIENMMKVRKEDGFGEAWVRIIKDGTEQTIDTVGSEPSVKKEEPVKVEKKTEQALENKTEEPIEKKQAEPMKINPDPEPGVTIPALLTEVVPNPKADPVYIPQTLKNTQAFFSLYNAANGRVLDGEVEVIDTERSKLLAKMKANSYLTLPDPKSKSGKLTLIGSSFGYRKIQHEMNYLNTEADTLQEDIDLIGNFYMIKFDLSRMVRGDIATLYNVYFYNDAAVMIPESKYELNKLLQMMQENPSYRLKLHGHTNGKGRGKIIFIGPEKDFFNVSPKAAVTESGSAKELSGARAQTIKDWLVSEGIAEARVETKAWGGDRMLHDGESQHARRNVRVEVEVMEN